MTESHPNAPERSQLLAAQTALIAGEQVSRRAELGGALFRIAIGLLIGGMLAVVVYIYPTHIAWLIVTSTVLYGIGIGLAIVVYQRRRIAASRGSNRGYLVAAIASLLLYGVGVLITSLGSTTGSAFWIPYILLTAFPLCLSGIARAIRPAR